MNFGELDIDTITDSMVDLLAQSYSIHYKKVSGDRYIEFDGYGSKIPYTDDDISMDNVKITKNGRFLHFFLESSNTIKFNYIFERENDFNGLLGEMAKSINENENLKVLHMYSQKDGLQVQGLEYIDKSTNEEFFYLYVASPLNVEEINIEGDKYTSVFNKKVKSTEPIEETNDEILIVDEKNPEIILQIIKNNKNYYPASESINKREKYEDFVAVATQNPYLKYKQTFISRDGEIINVYDDTYDENYDKTSKNVVEKTQKYKKKRKNIPVMRNSKRWRRRWRNFRRNVRKTVVKVAAVTKEVVKDPVGTAKKVKAAVKKVVDKVNPVERAKEEVGKRTRPLLARINRIGVDTSLKLPPYSKVAYYRDDMVLTENGSTVRETYGEQEGGFFIFLEQMSLEEINDVGGVITTPMPPEYQPGFIIPTSATYPTSFFGVTNHNGEKFTEIDEIRSKNLADDAFKLGGTLVDNAAKGIRGAREALANKFKYAIEAVFSKFKLAIAFVQVKFKDFKVALKRVKQYGTNKYDDLTKQAGKLKWLGFGKLKEMFEEFGKFLKNNGVVIFLICLAGSLIGMTFSNRQPVEVEDDMGRKFFQKCRYCYCNNTKPNDILCDENNPTQKPFDGFDYDTIVKEIMEGQGITAEEAIEKLSCETGNDMDACSGRFNGASNATELEAECRACQLCHLDIENCEYEKSQKALGFWSWIKTCWLRFVNSPTTMKVFWGLYIFVFFFAIPGVVIKLIRAVVPSMTFGSWGFFWTTLILETGISVAAEMIGFVPENYFVRDEGNKCRSARTCENTFRQCIDNRYYWVSPFCLQNYYHCDSSEKRYIYRKLPELDNASNIDKIINFPLIVSAGPLLSQTKLLPSIKNNAEIFTGYNNDIYKSGSDTNILLKPGGYRGNIYNIHFNGQTEANTLDIMLELVCSEDIIYLSTRGQNLFSVISSDGEYDSTSDDDVTPLQQLATYISNSLNGGFNTSKDAKYILIENGEISDRYNPGAHKIDMGPWFDNYIGMDINSKKKDINKKAGRSLMFKLRLYTQQVESLKGQIYIGVNENMIEGRKEEQTVLNIQSNELFVFSVDFTRTETERDNEVNEDFQFQDMIRLKGQPDQLTGETSEELIYGIKGVIQNGRYNIYTKTSGSGKLVLSETTNNVGTEIAYLPDDIFDYDANIQSSKIVVKKNQDKAELGILVYKINAQSTLADGYDLSIEYGDGGNYSFHKIYPYSNESSVVKFPAEDEDTISLRLTNRGNIYLIDNNQNENVGQIQGYETPTTGVQEPKSIISDFYNDDYIRKTNRNSQSLEHRCEWLYAGKSDINLVSAIQKTAATTYGSDKRKEHVKNVLTRISEFENYKRNFTFENNSGLNSVDLLQVSGYNILDTTNFSTDRTDPLASVFTTDETLTTNDIHKEFIDKYYLDKFTYNDQAWSKTTLQTNTDGTASEEYCNFWVLDSSGTNYRPSDVPNWIDQYSLLGQTLQIYIGPTEGNRDGPINSKLLSDDDTLIRIEEYNTTGVAIMKRTYTPNDSEQVKTGIESISEETDPSIQSSIFSVELPDYYYEEVAKGTWDFNNNIVVDYTNGKLYYRDSISTNEKIILLTDDYQKYIYPTEVITGGGIDSDGNEIKVQISYTAPFGYKEDGEEVKEIRILKVRRVYLDDDGNIQSYPGGWDSDLKLKSVVYYPTKTSNEHVSICGNPSGGGGSDDSKSVGKVNTIEKITDSDGAYLHHRVSFKTNNGDDYILKDGTIPTQDSNILIYEATTAYTQTAYTQVNKLNSSDTNTGLENEQFRLYQPTANTYGEYLLYLDIKIPASSSKSLTFSYSSDGDLIRYYDITTNGYVEEDPSDVSVQLTDSDSTLSALSQVTQSGYTGKTEEVNFAQTGEQEQGSYVGTFVTEASTVGESSGVQNPAQTASDYKNKYGSLSKLKRIVLKTAERISGIGKLFGKSKSINKYNEYEVTTKDMIYEFFGYLVLPSKIVQFKIEIDINDFALFYINNSYVIDTGFYRGQVFEDKITNGNRVSYISTILNYEEASDLIQFKLYYINAASNKNGIKIYWRFTNNEESIEKARFSLIQPRQFRLNDTGLTYIPSTTNSAKVPGLLYNVYDLQTQDNGFFKGDKLIKNEATTSTFNFNLDFLRKLKPSFEDTIEVGSSETDKKTILLPFPHMFVSIDESSLNKDKKYNFKLNVDNYTLNIQNEYGLSGKWDDALRVKARINGGENLYIHFIGYIKSPKTTDSLKFKASSDDGVIVSFDKKEIINDWSPHGIRSTESSNISVEQDYYYPFDVQFFQGHGGGQLDIQWNINGKMENIAYEHFYHISGMNDQNEDYGRDRQAEEVRKFVAKGGSSGTPKKAPYIQGYFATSYHLDRSGGRNTGSPKELIEPTKLIVNKDIRYSWGSGSVFGLKRDNIYNVLEGYIRIPERKTFKFATEGDDGIRLYFDKEIVVDDWGDHGARRRESKNIKKDAGYYSFRIENYEAGGGAAIRILWSMSNKWEYIPAKYYYVKNDLSNVQFFTNKEKFIGKKYTIKVGNSTSNVKTVTLDKENLSVSPIPVNKQDPRWTDSFSTSVVGKTLTVKRTDANAGWGQNLILYAEDAIEFQKRNKLIDVNNGKNYVRGTNVNVYELVAKGKERQRWKLMGRTVLKQEINFKWAANNTVAINGIGRKDYVYMEMFGTFKIPDSINKKKRGDVMVKFKLGSDDGSRLYLDGKLIIDNWRDQGYREKTSGYTKVALGSFHQYKVEYYETHSSAQLTLKWNLTQTGFNEAEYLTMYPDVKRGWRAPAKEHWNQSGRKEGRLSGDFKIIPKENLYRFNDKYITLDNIYKEAISENGEVELIKDSWEKPKFNQQLNLNNFKNIFNFRLSFQIKPLNKVPGWTNIMTMALKDRNYGVRGARFPAIWFFSNSTRFHIVCGGSRRERYNASINPKEHLPLNKIHNIVIERNTNSFKVILQIQNEDGTYMDTREYVKVCEGLTSNDIEEFKNLKFYFSGKYHKAADCEVKNLRIEMI